MNKKLLATAVGAVFAAGAMGAQAQPDVTLFGFTQITAEAIDRDEQDGLTFGADRVRIGTKISEGPIYGKLQIDFNAGGFSSGPAGTLPSGVKDAEVGYKLGDFAKVRLGQFKTPVGMDFNTSGKKLDITKRGAEKGLVLERTAGAMLSGRNVGGSGFGYDVGWFNPASRSSAVNTTSAQPGEDNAWAGRVMYDMADMLHVEASYGESENAGGPGTEDYQVWDIGAAYTGGPLTVKGEWIDGSNILGLDDVDNQVWFLHGGYMVTPMIEPVIRHYQADAEANSQDAELGNTYLGVNLFLGSNKTNGRLQLNYVVTSGDEDDFAAAQGAGAGAFRGFTDDAFLAQYQISY